MSAFPACASHQSVPPDLRVPTRAARRRPVPWTFSDVVGGDNFYSSILAALVARGSTGAGQNVVTSQLSATLQFQRATVAQVLNNSQGRQPDDVRTHLLCRRQFISTS